MAKHCQNCNFSTDNEFDDDCPICTKPLLTQKEHDHDWGAYVGNPGPWHSRLQKTQKIYAVLIVAFSIVAIIYWARILLNGRP